MRSLRPLLLTGLLVLAAAAHSQAPKAAPAASAKAPPVPLLWKVSDADNAVFVLGSFHLLKPDDYPLSKDVDDAFAQAERVVFEISPEEMASPTLGVQMGQAAMRTDGTLLDSELTPQIAAGLKTWTAANAEHLQKAGVPPQALQMFEPWFAGLMISLTEMGKMGLDAKLGLDVHFAAVAKKAGKPTGGLETGAQQIAFLDGMSKQEQLQMLAEALDESGEGRAELEKLHRQWREGDEQAIWEGMAAEMQAEYPELYRRINVERNDAWVAALDKRLKSDKDDTLLVVGALHTLGKDGVVQKLKDKGYRVERICAACAAKAKSKE